MSREDVPVPGEPVTAESFGELARFAATAACGSSLLLARLDENSVPVGELIHIVDVPSDAGGRDACLRFALSQVPAPTSRRFRVVFAFVDLGAPNGETVESYLATIHRFADHEVN